MQELKLQKHNKQGTKAHTLSLQQWGTSVIKGGQAMGQHPPPPHNLPWIGSHNHAIPAVNPPIQKKEAPDNQLKSMQTVK